MPAVVLEFELPRLPRSWEDGVDLALARMRRLKKRARISVIRKMTILRSGFIDWVEGFRSEDKRPIIKGEVRHSTLLSCHCCCLDARVQFDDVNLN